MAGRAQPFLGLRLVVEREGRELRDDAARQLRGGDRIHRLHQRLGLGQADENELGLLGDRDRILGDLDAGVLRLGAAVRVDVVADHLPAGRAQVLRDRTAHDAEADDPDLPLGLGFAHDISLRLASCARA